jgi:hypothetical protein
VVGSAVGTAVVGVYEGHAVVTECVGYAVVGAYVGRVGFDVVGANDKYVGCSVVGSYVGRTVVGEYVGSVGASVVGASVGIDVGLKQHSSTEQSFVVQYIWSKPSFGIYGAGQSIWTDTHHGGGAGARARPRSCLLVLLRKSCWTTSCAVGLLRRSAEVPVESALEALLRAVASLSATA